MLIDGTVLGDHSVVVALGIDTEGKKQMLGLREDHTEHSHVVKALLRDLVERGLDQETGATLRGRRREGAHLGHPHGVGTLGAIQRCQLHKRRNILGHLPDHLHANVTAVLREAWAAASVREGFADTLTLQRFGIAGVLYTKLRTTNAIENFNGAITTYSRNLKRWRSGTMVVRWVSAAIVEEEKKFRGVHGWPDITKVVSALGHLEAKEGASTERVA